MGDDLLFGNSTRNFDEPGNSERSIMSNSFHKRPLRQEVFFEDLQLEIIDIFNREPLENQPQAIVDNNCGYDTLLEEILQAIRSLTARGSHLAQLPIAAVASHQLPGVTGQKDELSKAIEQRGLTFKDQGLYLHFFMDRLVEADAQQAVNRSLTVLANDHPAHCLDRPALVDALTVLSRWQQHFCALAENLNNSRLLIWKAIQRLRSSLRSNRKMLRYLTANGYID